MWGAGARARRTQLVLVVGAGFAAPEYEDGTWEEHTGPPATTVSVSVRVRVRGTYAPPATTVLAIPFLFICHLPILCDRHIVRATCIVCAPSAAVAFCSCLCA